MHSGHLSFNSSDAERQYSGDVLELLHDAEAVAEAGIADSRARAAIVNAAERQFSDAGKLTHSYFTGESGLKADLARYFPREDLWTPHKGIIGDLTKGPHITCLATLFGVNTICATEHNNAMHLCCRYHLHKKR
jgi:hypothetical protein